MDDEARGSAIEPTDWPALADIKDVKPPVQTTTDAMAGQFRTS